MKENGKYFIYYIFISQRSQSFVTIHYHNHIFRKIYNTLFCFCNYQPEEAAADEAAEAP